MHPANKILLTGGAGYIGTNIYNVLEEKKNIVLVDNLSNGSPDILTKIFTLDGEFHNANLSVKAQAKEVFKDYQSIKSIIHLAGFKYVGESMKFPRKYLSNNINSLLNVLDNCSQGTELIFSSSCAVYDKSCKMPLTEKSKTGGNGTPYGLSKHICEEIIQDYCARKKIKAISLRYFNPIGATGQWGDYSEKRFNNIVPNICRGQISIFGNDYNTIDGTCIRDYIDVKDLALAHIKALAYLKTKGVGFYEAINIGSGKGISVLDLCNKFIASNKKNLDIIYSSRRIGDSKTAYCEINKAKRLLNWRPTINIEQSLKSAYKFELMLRR